ncbi:hypothetical protein E6R60_22685 [Streptomyces sp. A0642]|uniref:hypothetical protein n=1 Tax=Streptomyces sp. A0642 TaxID=2563100 RepID=UPI0010A244B3|nr:hypothetical protein [Streptomyces sp. A0642]THA73813.1 hypothetical protein E6R60_22685 [Streptomyces sp. A0642]
MSSRSISEKISASIFVLIAGLIADASAAALFLLSPDVRAWLKGNYFLVSITGLLLFAAVVTLANLLAARRVKVTELQGEVRNLTSLLAAPTNHDTEMFAAVNDQASPQTRYIIWLREYFMVTRANSETFRELEKMIEFFEREPRGFDDADMDGTYRKFREAGRDLINKMTEHMWYEGDELARLEIPREWERTQPERHEQAITEIGESHDSFMISYDDLFRMAQRKRLTSVLSGLTSRNNAPV